MNNLVTYTQAQRLKKLGFDKQTLSRYIESTGEFVSLYDYQKNDKYRTVVNWLKCPTVSEAIDFIREKGVDCCVFFNNELFGNLDNAKAIYYFKYGCNGRIIYNSWNVDYKSFDTHPLAESALLDAVLDYLEKK